MDVKAEIEIKDEELDFECNSYEEDIQIFHDNGTDFSSPCNIKMKELDEANSMMSELREIKKESMSDEEQVNNDVIKSDLGGKKSSFQHFKSLIGVANQGEKGSKMKSYGSTPYTSQLKTHDGKKFKCPHCSYEFNNKGHFNIHVQAHNNLKLFKCSECNYECKLKSSLKLHLQTHGNLFKCPECSFECNQKSNLRIHMSTHSNFKLFKCSKCSYGSNHKSNLKVHLLTHNKRKLFKCFECGHVCNQKSNLQSHLLTHGNLKLFKCSECGYKCNHKTSLKAHLLTHSNFELFKCSECNYESNRKGNLNIHLQIHARKKMAKKYLQIIKDRRSGENRYQKTKERVSK